MSTMSTSESPGAAAPSTPDPRRRPATVHDFDIDGDLMAGLWQEAYFAQLPDDAPPEVRAHVKDLEDPRRVYAIHKASRRHNFQSLVDRYIHQIRNGCGSERCHVATCFTVRKRLVGKAPIRRYNSSSARILAVYLASQDNPERGLCASFSKSAADSSDAVNNLIFSRRTVSPETNKLSRHRKGLSVPDADDDNNNNPTTKRTLIKSNHNHQYGVHQNTEGITVRQRQPDHDHRLSTAKISISEKSTNKDHRSFAATTFGTVAFKMLEWLSPQSLQTMSQKMDDLASPGTTTTTKKANTPRASSLSSSSTSTPTPEHIHTTATTSSQLEVAKKDDEPLPDNIKEPSSHDDLKLKRLSDGKVHATSIAKSARRGSLDSRHGAADNDETIQQPPFKSPSSGGFYHDKLSRRSKTEPTPISISEVPYSPPFFQNVPAPIMRKDDDASLRTGNKPPLSGHANRIQTTSKQPTDQITTQSHTNNNTTTQEDLVHDYPLPQSLKKLDLDLIDFICNVYQEDGSQETQFFNNSDPDSNLPVPTNKRPLLRRRKLVQDAISRKQWKLFNDQTLFDVMSAPNSLIASFTHEGRLYDSQTLWYCMVRLNQAAPSIVLHSLWMAASGLFIPPESIQQQLSKKLTQGGKKPLSNYQAGCIMATALHALVALAPVVSGSRALYDMSRIRSNGLAFSKSSAFPRYPANTSLQYDDCFSNSLAIRLARRLFCALTARRAFTDLEDKKGPDQDILHVLLNQLDLLNTGPARVLEFSESERLLHETRIPTLLLDWARAVLLNEWDESPIFGNTGPFHGALAFMTTMYENRNILLLGDIQFRVDYFSERLDTLQVPVAWLTFTSSRQQSHILDYPYLFRPETLVTFFRSINFSRMSRMFEEASSMKRRMVAIVDTGSLITHPHHKVILQDMLKTASSSYLVLDIGRSNVLRDAFDQLWRRQKRELLRPLKVHLGEDGGEEGFDSGGVQQEFFRMVIAECLDPDYGAFTVDDRTRMAWFVPGSIVEEWKFEMMGLLMSLAVYNGLTLPITFPKAFYRKLLGEPVKELYHIADGWPELASGLTTLLEWDETSGLVEDIFARTYEFSVPGIGQNITVEMTRDDNFAWPQGITPVVVPSSTEKLVTNDNRDDYVSDYIRYLTDVSIRPQFEAFQRGFRTCFEPKSLSLLTPPLLQSLVEGVQEIDISELKRYTRYVGWDSSDRTVRDFWSIVKRYDDAMKRKLLEFVTASDRVPVGGLRNLQFVLQKNGKETEAGGHLPTAYTCYGTLLLPEYPDKEVLRERLSMALQNAQGFGFA